MPISYAPYQAQLLQARAVGLGLSAQAADRLFELLQEWLLDVSKALEAGAGTIYAPEVRKMLASALDDLILEYQRATAAGVHLTARRVAEIHAQATVAVLSQAPEGAPLAAGIRARFHGLGIASAQAVLARPANAIAFQRLRKGHDATVDHLIQRHLIRGGDRQHFARALRIHMTGAEDFTAGDLRDLRTLSKDRLREIAHSIGLEGTPAEIVELRTRAGRAARHAELIARTETMNAEWEAGVQAAVESPVVAGIQWTLSGRHPERDECDDFAERDWYGLGPGVYDPRHIPPRPHPRCLCGRRHRLREPAEWGAPRGAKPPLQLDPVQVAELNGYPKSQRRNLVRNVGIAEGGPTTLKLATAGDVAAFQLARAKELTAARARFNAFKARVQALEAAAQGAPSAAAQAALDAAIAATTGKTPQGPIKEALAQAQAALEAAEAAQDAASVAAAKKAIDTAEQKLAAIQAAYAKSAAKKAADKLAAQKAAQAAAAKKADAKLQKLQQAATTAANAHAKAALALRDQAKNAGVPLQKLMALEAEADKAYISVWKSTSDPLESVRSHARAMKAKHLTLRKLVKEAIAEEQAKGAAAKAALGKKATALVKAVDDATTGKTPQGPIKAAIEEANTLLLEATDLGDVQHLKVIAAAKQKAEAKLEKIQAAYAKSAAKKKATPKPAQAAAAKVQAKAAVQDALAGKKPPAAPAPTPSAAGPDLTADTILGRQISGATGSNPGGLYEGTDGVRRYVKFYDDPTQALGESLANSIYRDLGLNAPESGTFLHNGRLAYWSRIVDDADGTVAQKGLNKATADKILDGFAADVLTANWDAVGTGFDNVLLTKGGALFRIDQGGTLLFRAKAGRKDVSVLNAITEWEYFAHSKNPYYSQVFQQAGLSGPDELAERVIDQIDRITALEQKAGGWRAYVQRIAPDLPAIDKGRIVDMLTARAQLLRAKIPEVRKAQAAIAQAKKEAEQRAKKLRKLVGKPPPRSAADKKQIAVFAGHLRQTVSAADLEHAREHIRDRKPGTDSKAMRVRQSINAAKRGALHAYLVNVRGMDSFKAKELLDHHDRHFRYWQGSADDSSGAAAIKWAASQMDGGARNNSFHWSRFHNHSPAENARLAKEGRNVATDHGTYKEADVLALFEAERNFTRAFGDVLAIGDNVPAYRNVQGHFFDSWKIARPKKGDALVVEHNAAVGFRGTVHGYDAPPFRLRVDDYTWDDVLRHFWTHDSASYTDENEIWILYRPVVHHVEKASGSSY